MSKLMFGFLLCCSAIIYNPEGARNFAREHASDMSFAVKNALYTIDNVLPRFMRFSRS